MREGAAAANGAASEQDSAVDDWTALLGSARVIRDPDALRQAATATFPTANAVVAILEPESREEVQECIRIANRRRVPYVDTFSPLVTHEQWLADLAQSGNGFPGQAGYGLMAWLVLHTGWHAWLGVPDDTV